MSLGGGGHKTGVRRDDHEPLDTLVPRVIDMLKAEVRRGTPVVV